MTTSPIWYLNWASSDADKRRPPFVLAVSSTKFKSVKDLIEYGVKNEVSYGTIGYGGSTHFASAQFSDATGIKTIAIPYKGTQDSLTDLMMNRVEFMFTPMQATKPLYDGGKINILGVISKNRSKILYTVPTFKELGLSSVIRITTSLQER